MDFTFGNPRIGAARTRDEDEALKEQRHRQALAFLEVARRQQNGPLSEGGVGSPSVTPQGFAGPQSEGPSVAGLDLGQFGNGSFAALQRNAPVLSPALGGEAPQQTDFAGAQTILNRPVNAALFNVGGEVTEGPIADDGGHNKPRDDNGKPSASEIRALRSKYRNIVRLGRIAQHHFAADNLDYWLSGRGGTKNISWKWLKKQPFFRAAYERNMDKVERGVELLEDTARSNGNPATASGVVSDSEDILARGRSDFYYGSGESDLDITAKIKVSIGSNGKMTTKAEINHRWHDKYNWNAGSYARIEAAWGLIKIDTYDDDALKLKAAGYGADFWLESKMTEHWR